MMQHTNTLRRFYVALGVGGREKYGKTYEFFFKERQQQELYHCENIIFFFPTSNFLRKHVTDSPPLPPDNVYFKCILLNLLYLGQFCIKM